MWRVLLVRPSIGRNSGLRISVSLLPARCSSAARSSQMRCFRLDATESNRAVVLGVWALRHERWVSVRTLSNGPDGTLSLGRGRKKLVYAANATRKHFACVCPTHPNQLADRDIEVIDVNTLALQAELLLQICDVYGHGSSLAGGSGRGRLKHPRPIRHASRGFAAGRSHRRASPRYEPDPDCT